MKILYLTFYFEPDLCAGSFRNTSLVSELADMMNGNDTIHVITTMPNRYKSFSEEAAPHEIRGNIEINRIKLPSHQSGLADQALAFRKYFINVLRLVKSREYDLVFASSSRLFTAATGSMVSRLKRIPLYLDIRDIFVDTMQDVFKSRIMKMPIMVSLKLIEHITFTRANHINLISGGFEKYFQKYENAGFSYHTNGIDSEFLSAPVSSGLGANEYIITYAGNIGEGQGLHKIIPQAAKILGPRYKFRIIGDGGIKKELQLRIDQEKITNIELLPPTGRKELMNYYKDSHFLFLHLNDYKAFEKVLPSKIFEYGAMDKPIIAGVGGFAAEFIRKHLTNYILFPPGDVDQFVDQLREYVLNFEVRTGFREKFDRKVINRAMAQSIIDSCKNNFANQ